MWATRHLAPLSAEFMADGVRRGLSERLLQLLANRGLTDAADLDAFFVDPRSQLHDPNLLPDAGAFASRIQRARDAGERVLVFGDFDADGLTGLAVMVLALRRLGLEVAPYVPDRTDEGHGLSLAAIDRALAEGRSLIITVDTGTSSAREIAIAAQRGIDVLVTDHHHVTGGLPRALAVVNPHRPDSTYPEHELAGAGVAFKVAQLLLGDEALEFADLAAIGTIADVAPLVGENRAIVRLGLELLRRSPRPGLAALLKESAEERARLDVDGIAFGVAPRLNAVGRVGDATVAAELLLTQDRAEAAVLAEQLRTANALRRELTATALGEAREVVGAAVESGVVVVAGPWPVGVIGLVAGRLAEEHGLPAVVFSTLADPWRASARSDGDFDLAAAFTSMGELFVRYGGHAGAAGCHLPAGDYAEFGRRMSALTANRRPRLPTLTIDLLIDAADVDYGLQRELALLEPTGAGNPPPLVGIRGLVVGRARVGAAGHSQLVLRKGREVLDAVAFGRDDIANGLAEGDQIDLVARIASRSFAGYESIQLEIRDVGPAGTLAALERQSAPVAA